jgi:hypothetical protein
MKALRIVVANMNDIKLKPDELGDWFFNTMIDNGFDPKQPVIMQPMLNMDSVEYIQYRFFWRWMWHVKIPMAWVGVKSFFKRMWDFYIA